MNNPEELNPELQAALKAELTETTPAPAGDYWGKIDASLAGTEISTDSHPDESQDLLEGDSQSELRVSAGQTSNSSVVAPAAAKNTRTSRLTKSMMGSAAGFVVLVVGGLAVVSLIGNAGSTEDSVANEAADFAVESVEEESVELDNSEFRAESQGQALEESAADNAEEESVANAVPDEAAEESADAEVQGSGSAGVGELTPLNEQPWLLELETGRVLAESQVLSFAESDIDSAGGQLGPVEIFVYQFAAVDNGVVDVILSGEVSDITYDIYDVDNNLLAEDEIITSLEVEDGAEYFVVITSEAATTFEFEVSISKA